MLAQQIINNAMSEANTPISLTQHFEIEMESETAAEETAYEINEGWSPFVEAEANGNKVCFRNCKMVQLSMMAHGSRQIDHAKIVNDEWFNGKGVDMKK